MAVHLRHAMQAPKMGMSKGTENREQRTESRVRCASKHRVVAQFDAGAALKDLPVVVGQGRVAG